MLQIWLFVAVRDENAIPSVTVSELRFLARCCLSAKKMKRNNGMLVYKWNWIRAVQFWMPTFSLLFTENVISHRAVLGLICWSVGLTLFVTCTISVNNFLRSWEQHIMLKDQGAQQCLQEQQSWDYSLLSLRQCCCMHTDIYNVSLL